MIDINSDKDRHIVSEVLVACDKDVSLSVLKAEPIRGALIQAVEVFHRCYDRISRIVWKYLHFQRQPGPSMRCAIKNQLKGHSLWRRTGW